MHGCKYILFATEEIAFGPVGFSAYTAEGVRYQEYDTIVFENVATNYGGAYDSGTGIFTCPVKGDYVARFSGTVGDLLSQRFSLCTCNVFQWKLRTLTNSDEQ